MTLQLSDHPQPNTPSKAQKVGVATEATVSTVEHSASHDENAADELLVEDLGTATLTAARYPRTDGTGGLAIAQISHSEVSGLLNDEHTQYQKESEKGAVNGYASLDGAGDVPDAQIPGSIARDSELHAQVHAAGHTGAGDQIDGDQLDIDFTPSNYTPATTPPEAADLDDLAAHLQGIDTKLGDIVAIKSTQRGAITLGTGDTQGTATISPAVVLAKTQFRYLGTSSASSNSERVFARGRILSTVLVDLIRGASGTVTIGSWEIMEFE